jgi:quaternary ammonium compound-resistance protein SugE
MAWVYLFVAALFEVGWAIGLKYTQGFTKLGPSVLTIAAMIISMTLLAIAVKTIPIGTGYAIWTGIGAVGAAMLGIWLFKEPASAARLGFLALIVIGIIGLKMTASEQAEGAPATDARSVNEIAQPQGNPTRQ